MCLQRRGEGVNPLSVLGWNLPPPQADSAATIVRRRPAVPDPSPPSTPEELLALWARVIALRAELVAAATHWEERFANPPPSANDDFFRSTQQLRDDAAADLGWLDAQLEGHLKRKDPPYRLFERWSERRVGHRDRAIRTALSRTREVLQQLYRLSPTTPDREELAAAAVAVLGAIQACVPVTTPAPRIQGVPAAVQDDTTKAFIKLTRHRHVKRACHGELDKFGGKEMSYWPSTTVGAAVLLSLAGLPMRPRMLMETYA